MVCRTDGTGSSYLCAAPTVDTGRPVVVLGMHRSGTSVVAGVLHELGLSLSIPEDVLPAQSYNLSGLWESAALQTLNNQVMALCGGTWAYPPELDGAWADSDMMCQLMRQAREIFPRVYPSTQWVWKDPRTCITLPFWLRAIPTKPAAVIVIRNPLDVASSLQTRDGYGKAHSLALWERYTRSAVLNAAGLSAALIHYDDLMAEPRRTISGLAQYLTSVGVHLTATDNAPSLVDNALRHHAADPDAADPDLSDGQRQLYTYLRQIESYHERLPELPLGPETASTSELLASLRAINRLESQTLRRRGARLGRSFLRAATRPVRHVTVGHLRHTR